MIALLKAVLAMALKDAAATLLVISEARGRAVMAGVLDAAGDLALILFVIYGGAAEVSVHGWSPHAALIVGTVCIVSFIGTMFWTKVGQRIVSKDTERLRLLEARCAALEAQLQ